MRTSIRTRLASISAAALLALALATTALPGTALMATIAPKQLRGPGHVLTAPVDVRAIASTAMRYTFSGLMDAADLQDPALHITNILLEGTTDPTGAAGWHLLAMTDWTGGHAAKDKFTGAIVFAPPSLSYATSTEVPAWIRGSLDLPRAVNLGVDMSVVPM